MSEPHSELLAVHVKYMDEKFDHFEKRMDGLATSKEVAELREAVQQILPWTKTLENLERAAKWLTVIVGAISALYLAFKGFGK